jgi:hypothetical protein
MTHIPKNDPRHTGDPRVPTAATGDSDLTAASTAFVQDAFATHSPPLARIEKTGAQTFTTGVTATVTGYVVDLDTDTMTGTANRITFQTAGVYLVNAQVTFDPNAAGTREVIVRKNGTTNIVVSTNHASSGGSNASSNASFMHEFAATDYIEMRATQTSGGNLDLATPAEIRSFLEASYLGQP